MVAEKIEVEVKNKRPDGLISMAMEGLSNIHYKQLAILFLLFLFLSNDVFIDRVMAKANNSFVSYPGQLSTIGTVVQGIILVLLFLVASILIEKKVI
jgi:hypothetical protein